MSHHTQTAQFLPGSVIANRYMVESVIGSGAFGTVYGVLDVKTSTELALKVLNDEMRTHAHAHMMMMREGQILQKLEHPNIVPIYDIAFHAGEQLTDPSAYIGAVNPRGLAAVPGGGG